MLDKNDANITVKCQAQASDSEVTKTHTGSNNNSTKSIAGSTTGHQAESLDSILSSKTAQVYDQEEDEVMVGKEQEDGAGGEDRGEVEITGEWTAGTRKERRKARRDAAGKSSEDPGAMPMASKKVKTDTKNHSQRYYLTN